MHWDQIKDISDLVTVLGVAATLLYFFVQIVFQKRLQRLTGEVAAERVSVSDGQQRIQVELRIDNAAEVRITFDEITCQILDSADIAIPVVFPSILSSTTTKRRYSVDAKSTVRLRCTVAIPASMNVFLVRATYRPTWTSDSYLIERAFAFDEAPQQRPHEVPKPEAIVAG